MGHIKENLLPNGLDQLNHGVIIMTTYNFFWGGIVLRWLRSWNTASTFLSFDRRHFGTVRVPSRRRDGMGGTTAQPRSGCTWAYSLCPGNNRLFVEQKHLVDIFRTAASLLVFVLFILCKIILKRKKKPHLRGCSSPVGHTFNA